jgi:5-methylcytosine-specific restriction endonuclease McrA
MKKYRNYTDEQVIEVAKNVKSIAAFLRGLDLKPVGGNYYTAHCLIERLEIDTSHWTGKVWNKGSMLKNWSNYSKASCLKPHLIKDRGHVCESCKNTHWLEELIKLEIHHIDNNRTNNQPSNLQLLCPNCHSVTDGWRKRKKN